MKLYFSPLACSLAPRIVAYEAGLDVAFLEVDPQTKRLPDGTDYLSVHPVGLVPALETEDGALVTENAAVLQHLGRHWQPAVADAPAALHQWLSFVATELHKVVFFPLFDRQAPPEAKQYALTKAAPRLGYVDQHLADREYLLGDISVADAYLYTILNWTIPTPIELADYPNLAAYHARMSARPHVKRAFEQELPLYRAEQARAAG